MRKNNAAATSFQDGENLQITLIKMLNITENTGFPYGLPDSDRGSVEMKICVSARGGYVRGRRGVVPVAHSEGWDGTQGGGGVDPGWCGYWIHLYVTC